MKSYDDILQRDHFINHFIYGLVDLFFPVDTGTPGVVSRNDLKVYLISFQSRSNSGNQPTSQSSDFTEVLYAALKQLVNSYSLYTPENRYWWVNDK